MPMRGRNWGDFERTTPAFLQFAVHRLNDVAGELGFIPNPTIRKVLNNCE